MAEKQKQSTQSTAQQPDRLLSVRPKRSKWLALPFVALFAVIGIAIVLKTFAATAPAGDSNDIIRGGISTASTPAARRSLLNQMGSNAGAREMYAYFGITDKEINSATLARGFNPRTSAYRNWWSFGRNNNGAPGTQGKYIGRYKFYVKPVKNAWKSTVSMTGPVLTGKTKDGRTFIIHTECGNLAISTLTPFVGRPAVSVIKQAVSPAAGSTVKPGDIVSYRIIAKSTGNIPAYVRVKDSLPSGTSFVSEAVETKNAFRLADETAGGLKYLVWGNGNLAPGSQVKILIKVKVNPDVTAGFCNFALYTWVSGQALPGKTNSICHNVSNTPTLKISKDVTSISEATKVENGSIVTYTIRGQNTGTGASKSATFVDQVTNDGRLSFVELGPLLRGGKPVPASEIAAKQIGHVQPGDATHKYYGYVLKSMAPGDRISFTITLKVVGLTNLDTKVCNLAVVYDSRPSPSGVLGYDQVCNPTKITVVVKPELNITKEAVSPSAGTKVHVGDQISYKVVIKNSGDGPVSNVVVNDPFPAHSKGAKIDRHVENSGAKGFQDTSNEASFSWSYSSLAPGAQGEVYFKLTVQDGKDGDSLCNVATITSNPGDTSEQVCHPISGLVLSKSATFVNRKDANGKPLVASTETVAQAGDEIEYSLTTKNNAATPLNDFVVEENLEDVLEYADITDPGQGTLNDAKTTLSWKVNIPGGTSVVNKFRVKVKSPIPQNTPKPTNPGSYDYKMYNVYGNEVTIPVEKPIIQTIIDNLPQTGALGFLMIPLALAAILVFAYTSGMLSGSKRLPKPTAGPHASTIGAEPAHRPGDEFTPDQDEVEDGALKL